MQTMITNAKRECYGKLIMETKDEYEYYFDLSRDVMKSSIDKDGHILTGHLKVHFKHAKDEHPGKDIFEFEWTINHELTKMLNDALILIEYDSEEEHDEYLATYNEKYQSNNTIDFVLSADFGRALVQHRWDIHT